MQTRRRIKINFSGEMPTFSMITNTKFCLRNVIRYGPSHLFRSNCNRSCCTEPTNEIKTYELKEIVEDGNNFIIRLNAKPDITT